MALAIYDTLRRDTVPFEPRRPGTAAIYVCGPTVYGDAHVGHGRFAVVFDVLNRYLRWSGLDVLFVMNITDVDDKIIARANDEGVSASAVADRYTRAWNQAMDALGCLPPDVQPQATGHIIEMQDLIARLVDAGKAYPSDGNVLFRVREFPEYGRLSGRRLEDAQQPTDVTEVAKEDPLDFALWKAAKPGEPAWPSPWGPGRPGWHIECSAMAAKHLGTPFDLHGGGVDLVFPHHENEIAQHGAAHGDAFARYWMHNGMLRMADAKMARSVGNVVSIDAALARWGRGAMRTWYYSAAYRSPLTFDDDLLDEAANAFDRLVTFVRNARTSDATPDPALAEPYRKQATDALDDDLNLPGALAVLHAAVHDGNEALERVDAGDAEAQATVAALAEFVVGVGDDVLGLGIDEALAPAVDLADRLAPLVDELLGRRQEARQARDFATADAIRARLADAGITVEDRPGGPRWHVELGSRGRSTGASAGASAGTAAASPPSPDRDDTGGLPTADI